MGVEDVSRQGALRYRRPEEEAFLAHEVLTVPPVANLKELEAVARDAKVILSREIRHGILKLTPEKQAELTRSTEETKPV